MGLSARARLSRRVADERGFTLVELIVTMAIMVIVVASLSSVLVSATHSQVDANNRFQAQEQARTGLAYLTRELHCASSVTQTSGTSLSAGTNYNAISATLPSACATARGVALFATWCTLQSTLNTSDWALYRVTSTASRPTCASSGKVKWADYLQTSTPFCLPSTTVACGAAPNSVLKPTLSLPMLHVTMPVNLKGPSSTIGSFDLIDDIALRNGARS
jgi:prepilin-type N-terminal cleavage/methylation domain-containing protein